MLKNYVLLIFINFYQFMHVDGVQDYKKSLFCRGRLLHDVQTSGIFNSQRDFLELKLSKSEEVIEHRYKILRPKIKIHEKEGREKLKEFIRKHFENVTALEMNVPSDWKARFSLLEKVSDENMKEILKKMNRNWIKYGRKMKKEVAQDTSSFSFLPIRYPFFVDKGQNEMHYEIYWTFEALLACDMVSSAKNLLRNFFGLVHEIGHVPPENRIFFIDRCSPPFLPIMLNNFYRKTGDINFVQMNLRYAQLDFLYWFKDRNGWADFEPNRGQTGISYWPGLTRDLNLTFTPMTPEENIMAVRILLNSGKETEAKEIARKWISSVNRQNPGLLETSITILMIDHFPDLKIEPEENKRVELNPIYALASFFLVLFNVYPTIEKVVLALFL